MGIAGLLSFVKDNDGQYTAITVGQLSDFRGKRAAVDAYSWIHKGIYCCAYELFRGQESTKYVEYCLRYVKMLTQNDITPVMVFDGGRMPFKVVEEKRRQDRRNARKQANELLITGNFEQARTQIVQAIDVTTAMAWKVMEACRAEGIECIVAPYEADAQMAYLETAGYVDLIITEDSDMIIFGCKTILFKLNQHGVVDVYDRSKLEGALRRKSVRFSNFGFEKLRHAAILSGCDYCKNLPGIGLAKAWKFINMTQNTDPRQFLKKIPSYLKMQVQVSDEFVKNFLMADLSFLYQAVFDPVRRIRVPIHPLLEADDNDDYQKFIRSFPVAMQDPYQLALGNVDSKGNTHGSYDPMKVTFKSIFRVVKTLVDLDAPGCSAGTGAFTIAAYKNPNAKKPETITCLPPDEDANSGDALVSYYSQLVMKKPAKEEPVVEEPPKKKARKIKFSRTRNDEELLESGFFQAKNDGDMLDTVENDAKTIREVVDTAVDYLVTTMETLATTVENTEEDSGTAVDFEFADDEQVKAEVMVKKEVPCGMVRITDSTSITVKDEPAEDIENLLPPRVLDDDDELSCDFTLCISPFSDVLEMDPEPLDSMDPSSPSDAALTEIQNVTVNKISTTKSVDEAAQYVKRKRTPNKLAPKTVDVTKTVPKVKHVAMQQSTATVQPTTAKRVIRNGIKKVASKPKNQTTISDFFKKC